MALATNLGYPRIGLHRELKKGLESYWAGNNSKNELLAAAKTIRTDNWLLQKKIGIQHIPVNDFSLYDHVLDTAILVGAIPDRFKINPENIDLDGYFAMARGTQQGKFIDIPPLEMTKWFNTNYHYIVPEITRKTMFALNPEKVIVEIKEADSLAIHPRPVLLGPVSFLLLSKSPEESFTPLGKLDELVSVYSDLLHELSDLDVDWVQMDEPFLATDLTDETKDLIQKTYLDLGKQTQRPKILITSYFASIGDNLPLAFSLPVEALHLDLVNAPEQLEPAFDLINDQKCLSLGLVDGHNIWKTDLVHASNLITKAIDKLGNDHLFISPSCSLLHVPQDIGLEININPEIRSWLAFAQQKIQEIVLLTKMANSGIDANHAAILESQGIIRNRHSSPIIKNVSVKSQLAAIDLTKLKRRSEFAKRRRKQQERYEFPFLPTTTIGSFPQTEKVRIARSRFAKGQITKSEYEEFIKQEIKRTIEFQEQIGMDVLVHGEFERNDMVQYFAEQLSGFAFTEHGWVQSFGSRYVRPPIIFGDISRPGQMSVEWAKYAQSQSDKPVKGMLTGPVTILNWSFVRDDQLRSDTCRQIALAIQEEVLDLERSGIGIIQIDEPALREGLPLHKADWQEYLNWAVECFHLAASSVQDETQIHTHMCYSEFNDIIQSIAELDADVISIEAARSHMELLKSFAQFQYPNDLGPGIYDIHSPRIPTEDEIITLLKEALGVLPASQVWVNPDCGLKTRQWAEIEPSLINMVSATLKLRKELLNKR